MGNDGGSIPRREELVKVKATTTALPPSVLAKVLWTTCALSRQPFHAPVVADALGNIFNKESVVQYLLKRSERAKDAAGGKKDGAREKPVSEEDLVAGHIRGLKDVTELKVMWNPTYKADLARTANISLAEVSTTYPFLCPLTSKELSGKHRCVYMRTCGCMFTESGLKAVCSEAEASSSTREAGSLVRACPSCATHFKAGSALVKGKSLEPGDMECDVLLLNPAKQEQEKMREAMVASREAAAANKATRDAESKKDDSAESEAKRKRKAEKRAAKEEQIRALQAELAENEGPQDAPAAKRARLEKEPTNHHGAPRTGLSYDAKQLAEQAKQVAAKKALSPAIAQVYGAGAKKVQGETWMTRGTFNRFA